jgi:integrase
MLYQGLRREEVARLRVKDMRLSGGFLQLEVRGKGGKTRYLPVNAHTAGAVHHYLNEAGHSTDAEGTLFRVLRKAGGNPRNSAPVPTKLTLNGTSRPDLQQREASKSALRNSVSKPYAARSPQH